MASKSLVFDMFALQAVPWPVMLQDVLYLEKIGANTVWVADHYASPPNPTVPLLESWATLAALSSRTERVRLGTMVSNTATRHPAMLAKQAATVDLISGGRLELGVGPGYYEKEHLWLGIPFLTPSERVERFREAVEIIDRLLREHQLSYEGRYYSMEEAPFVPPPVQQPRPPLTIAADGKKALRVVAEYADRWVTLGKQGVGPEECLRVIGERNRTIDEYCAEIGRDQRRIERAYFVGWAGETPFASVGAFQDFVGRYREAGIERFVFCFASEGRYASAVAAGTFANRSVLDSFAAEAMATLGRED